ncbi:tctex1 domain-containing protein 1-B [Aplysia californica]|uniref:Tctex1 domain-containing protein 1-B n=1 Tax=Aplysia californica TaxID=6500 RepID=A0ABM0JU40_APLCA|nr:tctex1 domain-containing protein 1-B [Aplysia californica]
MTDVVDHPVEPPQGRRRQSLLPRDTEGMMAGPNIRRMSRMDARPSVQYGLAGRRMSHVSRSSISGNSFGLKDFKMPMQLQNTYRMAPTANERFQAKKAEDVIKQVLESYLGNEKYNHEMCNSMIKQISELITARVKDLGFSQRYKFVSVVTIGQNRNQGIAVASRSMWNTETDSYAAASFASGDVFAVGCVYATYFE